MPRAQKTQAQQTSLPDSTQPAITPAEYALQEITTGKGWSLFKGQVVAAACRLYQNGHLTSAEDIDTLLKPLDNEIKEAIGIATGLYGAKQHDKLITLLLDGHDLKDAIHQMELMFNLTLSEDDVSDIVLAHKRKFDAWYTAPLNDRYYPLVFLRQIEVSLYDNRERRTTCYSPMDLAFGIDAKGNKELISFHIHPLSSDKRQEMPYPYAELLRQLNERGLPAPLLFGGKFQQGQFHQQLLAEFFPQSYFIPHHEDTLKTVSDTRFSRAIPNAKREMKYAVNGLYKSQTLNQIEGYFNLIEKPQIDAMRKQQYLRLALIQVFCPEVRQALVAAPESLRKLMFEKKDLALGDWKLFCQLSRWSMHEIPLLNIMAYLCYQQVIRPELTPIRPWAPLCKDFQTFVQNMQEAQAPVAPLLIAAQKS